MIPRTFRNGEIPLCFSEPQFRLWSEQARIAPHGLDGVSVCADCTPEFQKSMIAVSRCEFPEVQFAEDADGFIGGFVPKNSFLNRQIRWSRGELGVAKNFINCMVNK